VGSVSGADVGDHVCRWTYRAVEFPRFRVCLRCLQQTPSSLTAARVRLAVSARSDRSQSSRQWSTPFRVRLGGGSGRCLSVGTGSRLGEQGHRAHRRAGRSQPRLLAASHAAVGDVTRLRSTSPAESRTRPYWPERGRHARYLMRNATRRSWAPSDRNSYGLGQAK
jgi:hypothetical protein